MSVNLIKLAEDVRNCELCATDLPLGANPVIRVSANAKLLIIGQAPGTRVHATGIPWNDPSGNRLRAWMNLEPAQFYSETIAIVPMGFCYPGKGKRGDLPPRPECAPKWHPSILTAMPQIELILLVGSYAQAYYLSKQERAETLAETVKNWQGENARYFPLPHPSPRNHGWLKKNPWFEEQVVPLLRQRLAALL